MTQLNSNTQVVHCIDLYVHMPVYVVFLSFSVGPLVLDCSLSPQMEIECLSSNQLDLNQTVCSFRGSTMDHCKYPFSFKLSPFQTHTLISTGILPYKIDVKGWPLGTHVILVSATDVFGSSAEAAFEYIGEVFARGC